MRLSTTKTDNQNVMNYMIRVVYIQSTYKVCPRFKRQANNNKVHLQDKLPVTFLISTFLIAYLTKIQR